MQWRHPKDNNLPRHDAFVILMIVTIVIAWSLVSSLLFGVIVAILCHCCRHCHHCPIAQRDCFAVLLPIVPPLPITTATFHCNLAAAVHCNCRCRPSCAVSHCAALPIAIILWLRCPLRHRCSSPQPPSFAISSPPTIVISTAIHLTSPPIA